MDLLSDLNEPQRRAVTHGEGPILVLAGAGSGKTRVITRRVAYLIDQGVAPRDVLAITFTNKAAGEMKERIEALGTPRGATVCTFHSLCVRLLREFAAEAALPAGFSIYDRADQLRLVKEATVKAELPTERLAPAAVHAAISKAKNKLVTAEAFAARENDFFARQAARIYREYQKLLAAANALDFDDLLMRSAFLMRDRPDVLLKLQELYRYVLIDEYQDTNRAQYLIAHGIAERHENICATGDPDQSIYAWRGADIGNIMEFESDYPNAIVVRLEENYRSTAPILQASSRLIAHNKMRKEKALWTQRQGGRDVRILACDDEHTEARQVAWRILEVRKAGRQFDDIAVFYRVNSLSRVLEEELINSAVPYRIARGVEFYNRKEIKDVLAYLKLMVNPADDLSCQRIVNTPPRGIGDATVKRLSAFASERGWALLEACRRAGESGLPGGAAAKASAFASLIDSLAGSGPGSVRGTIEEVLRRSRLGESCSEKEEEGRQAAANLAELVSTAEEFDRSGGDTTLADYLYQVSLVSDVDHFEGEAGAVSLMTLHAAKGLEFPAIFIIGCEDGLLPFRRLDGDLAFRNVQDTIEEERRLAFVGMTRAKEELTLSYANQRMVRGKTMPQTASPFIEQIGRRGVQVEDCRLARPQKANGPQRPFRGGFYADPDDRAAIEALADGLSLHFPPEYEGLAVGSRVNHPKFGRGKIAALHQPWPDTRAEVVFDRWGRKTIVLAVANMQIVS